MMAEAIARDVRAIESISDYDEMIELEEQLSRAAANDGNLTTDLADSGLILTCALHRGVIVIARLRWRMPGSCLDM
jgi:hypothetical protein